MIFHEKTEAERGFSTIWEDEVLPSISKFDKAVRRAKIIGRAGSFLLALIMLPAAAYIWTSSDFEAGSDGYRYFWPITIFIYLIAQYPFWIPKNKLEDSFGDFLRNAISTHFKEMFGPSEDEAKAASIVDTAIEGEIVVKGNVDTFSNFHVGKYRGCDLVFFNVPVRYQSAGRSGGSDTRHYFILQISVPIKFNGTTGIVGDKGALLSRIKGALTTGRLSSLTRVKLDNLEFERRYEVFSDDENEARRLLDAAFLDNFMALGEILGEGDQQGRSLRALFKDGQFIVALPNDGDFLEVNLGSHDIEDKESTARIMIKKLAIIPKVVDCLHGD